MRYSAFLHLFFDLGDIVMIFIYCASQGIDFDEFRKRVLPFADIVPLESDPVENGRHIFRKSDEDPRGTDEDAAGYFVSSPSEQPVIGHMMTFRDLKTVDREAIAESMKAANEIWVDLYIPASTPDSAKLLKSIVAVRQLSAEFYYIVMTSK